MIINHNMSAMFSQRQQKFNVLETQGNMEKLSSGMRINRAGDDASGLAVSEKCVRKFVVSNEPRETQLTAFR